MSEAADAIQVGDKYTISGGPFPDNWVYYVIDVVTSRVHGYSVKVGVNRQEVILDIPEAQWSLRAKRIYVNSVNENPAK